MCLLFQGLSSETQQGLCQLALLFSVERSSRHLTGVSELRSREGANTYLYRVPTTELLRCFPELFGIDGVFHTGGCTISGSVHDRRVASQYVFVTSFFLKMERQMSKGP